MSKPIIAVDIDDVLSASAEGFIAFSNQQYGTSLTMDDYSEHWAELWKVDAHEVHRRAGEIDAAGVVSRYAYKDGASDTLKMLKQDYTLIAITSRRTAVEPQTRAWINVHCPNIFDEIKFAGIFDGPIHLGMLTKTKADLFASSKVSIVIDDQLKHCLAAAELGIETVLFGNYPWNQATELPEKVTRCADWASVKEYFDGRS